MGSSARTRQRRRPSRPRPRPAPATQDQQAPEPRGRTGPVSFSAPNAGVSPRNCPGPGCGQTSISRRGSESTKGRRCRPRERGPRSVGRRAMKSALIRRGKRDRAAERRAPGLHRPRNMRSGAAGANRRQQRQLACPKPRRWFVRAACQHSTAAFRLDASRQAAVPSRRVCADEMTGARGAAPAIRRIAARVGSATGVGARD